MSLQHLAHELGVSQRTLRRWADQGLIKGTRVSPRHFHVPLREENYLRRHWPLLRQLRTALRTEPNVRLAVLFGSAARGELHDLSDVDLLVALRRDSAGSVAALAHRLSERTGRPVQPVRLHDAENRPALFVEAMNDGRVLIDRDQQWTGLLGQVERLRKSATEERQPFDAVLADAGPLTKGDLT